MMKIIIVEKNAETAYLIAEVLRANNSIEMFCTNEQAYVYYQQHRADVILLDNNYPGLYVILDKIRQRDQEILLIVKGIPVIEGEIELILGLGADNFITHFAPMEILAYVKALLRTNHRQSENEYMLNERVCLSMLSQRLCFPHTKQLLSWRDCQILGHLVKNKGKIVSAETLILDSWSEVTPDTKTYLAKAIIRLRNFLKDEPDLVIEAIRGRGYRLAETIDF